VLATVLPSVNMDMAAQAQQMMEMQTAQFYQQYMSQYQAMVSAYDARASEEDPGSASAAAGIGQAAFSPQGAQGAGEVNQPALPQTADAPLTAADLQQQIGELEEQLRETEVRTKRAATLSKHFVGIIDRFDTKKGHGFVACAETYAKYQQDIFIDRESFQGARVGDTVVFSLGFNKKGAVRACDVRKLKEVSRIKEELEEKRTQHQYLKAAGAAGVSLQSMMSLLNPKDKGGGKAGLYNQQSGKSQAGWEKQGRTHDSEQNHSNMIYAAGKRASSGSQGYSLDSKRRR